jgi:hypothetical protein
VQAEAQVEQEFQVTNARSTTACASRLDYGLCSYVASVLVRLAQFGETLLDFTVEGKASANGLREDLPAVDDHIELPGFTGFHLHFLIEEGF